MIQLQIDTKRETLEGSCVRTESGYISIECTKNPILLAHELAHCEVYYKKVAPRSGYKDHAKGRRVIREIEAWEQAAKWCTEGTLLETARECLATYIKNLEAEEVQWVIQELEAIK